MGSKNSEPEKRKINVSNSTVCVDKALLEISGKWLKVARVQDEDWIDGQVPEDPESFITKIKNTRINADIFTFSQKIPDWKPKYQYRMEWDNKAAIPITTYQEWWERVSSDMRKDVKRAEKRGIIVKGVELDDEIIKGVVEINNDTPFRQGKPFVHYGKDFETVKREYSTYLDKSEFIGAYYNEELVGIIKMVYVGELACLMEILSKTKHNEKRPNNAMIAKAVELSESKKKSYLTYGNYHYGKKKKTTFVDFKRRCGFEQILYPRYYIPLTIKGWIAVKLKLQLGLIGILPGIVISAFLYCRSFLYQKQSSIARQ